MSRHHEGYHHCTVGRRTSEGTQSAKTYASSSKARGSAAQQQTAAKEEKTQAIKKSRQGGDTPQVGLGSFVIPV